MDNTINSIINKVIKDRPSDPLSAIATLLLTKSRGSFPTFDRLTARRVFIGDNP